MIRRSFRFGLALGLLGGLAAALAKMLGTRSDPIPSTAPPAPAAPWPRLTVEEAPEPTAASALTSPAPAVAVADGDPAADVGLVLPEHPPTPAPKPRQAPLTASTPAPTVAPPVKKVAPAKKAAPPAEAAAPAPASPTKKAAKAPPKVASKAAKAGKKAAPPVTWVEPLGDVCPTTHPVKGKLGSLIFHVPGGLNYARTRPDRCYLDAAAAEAEGLRPAKR